MLKQNQLKLATCGFGGKKIGANHGSVGCTSTDSTCKNFLFDRIWFDGKPEQHWWKMATVIIKRPMVEINIGKLITSTPDCCRYQEKKKYKRNTSVRTTLEGVRIHNGRLQVFSTMDTQLGHSTEQRLPLLVSQKQHPTLAHCTYQTTPHQSTTLWFF